MSITTDVAAFDASVDVEITTQTDPNTIPPVTVGEAFKALSALLETYYGQVFNVLTGTAVPNDADGADTDLYFRNNNPIEVYQKVGGTWGSPKATLDLGIIFPDGPLIGLQTSISGFVVTVTSGGWTIDNVIYRKDIPTGFTLSAADLNFGRYDVIYADENDDILIEEGTPASTPVQPAIPANTIIVDIAFIPVSSTGQSPYLLYGNNTGASSVPITISDDFDPLGNFDASAFAISSVPIFQVYQSGISIPATYDNTTKIISGGTPGAFTAKFI